MNIVLGVSGGIAAYKAPDLVRRLRDIGAAVRVVLTPNATRFVSPMALAAVSDRGVVADSWGDASSGGVDHIELARWAELLLIAPATANIIAKLTTGIADDALSTYAVAHRNRVMIAPAMNTFMYRHATVVSNLAILRSRGVHVLDPDSGLLACGDEGVGRMPNPEAIAQEVQRLFDVRRDLADVRVLVTAGPTREPIDPVRYLSNRSSGRMGYALAAASRDRGAVVTLVSGPVGLPAPAGVEVVAVTTAEEMAGAVMSRVDSSDVVIKAAAVADFTPVHMSESKIKKSDKDTMTIELRKTRDIVASIGQLERRPLLVAFAAETDTVEAHAREKLGRKNADMIVANDVSDVSIGFDSDQNEVTVLRRDRDAVRIARAPKREIAEKILDLVVEALSERTS